MHQQTLGTAVGTDAGTDVLKKKTLTKRHSYWRKHRHNLLFLLILCHFFWHLVHSVAFFYYWVFFLSILGFILVVLCLIFLNYNLILFAALYELRLSVFHLGLCAHFKSHFVYLIFCFFLCAVSDCVRVVPLLKVVLVWNFCISFRYVFYPALSPSCPFVFYLLYSFYLTKHNLMKSS